MTVTPSRGATPELKALANLFYLSLDELGAFEQVAAEEIPGAARELLWHDEHMTVTVERHYGGPVDLRVLTTHATPTHYSRRIVLTRPSNNVVLFGIVRLNVSVLERNVRDQIENQDAPLGRILIQHGVLRHVRLLSLWRIQPGPDLNQQFVDRDPERPCYGRTALIYCNGLPAVELLEVVDPA